LKKSAVLKPPGTEINKVFLLLFVHKKKFFLECSKIPALRKQKESLHTPAATLIIFT